MNFKKVIKLIVDNKGYGTGELMVIFVGLAALALTVFNYLGEVFMGDDGSGGILGGVESKLDEVLEGVGEAG